uniref:hypothetical protein n=1 Tax=Polypodium hydriforme TaxID=43186 RepID=UPI002113A304|nr:hypothetical protein NQY43_mgp03 [Polypodium hydriforme]USZ79604.1 hypothetical protein [Polypodium hydriforme]
MAALFILIWFFFIEIFIFCLGRIDDCLLVEGVVFIFLTYCIIGGRREYYIFFVVLLGVLFFRFLFFFLLLVFGGLLFWFFFEFNSLFIGFSLSKEVRYVRVLGLLYIVFSCFTFFLYVLAYCGDVGVNYFSGVLLLKGFSLSRVFYYQEVVFSLSHVLFYGGMLGLFVGFGFLVLAELVVEKGCYRWLVSYFCFFVFLLGYFMILVGGLFFKVRGDLYFFYSFSFFLSTVSMVIISVLFLDSLHCYMGDMTFSLVSVFSFSLYVVSWLHLYICIVAGYFTIMRGTRRVGSIMYKVLDGNLDLLVIIVTLLGVFFYSVGRKGVFSDFNFGRALMVVAAGVSIVGWADFCGRMWFEEPTWRWYDLGVFVFSILIGGYSIILSRRYIKDNLLIKGVLFKSLVYSSFYIYCFFLLCVFFYFYMFMIGKKFWRYVVLLQGFYGLIIVVFFCFVVLMFVFVYIYDFKGKDYFMLSTVKFFIVFLLGWFYWGMGYYKVVIMSWVFGIFVVVSLVFSFLDGFFGGKVYRRFRWSYFQVGRGYSWVRCFPRLQVKRKEGCRFRRRNFLKNI